MSNDNNLFVDILNLFQDDSLCFIQAPSLENKVIDEIMAESEYDYYKIIILSKTNKEKIISQELVSAISAYVQSMEIRTGGKKVFEGYDGIKYGAISKDVVVPDWFKGRYISAGLCDVSIYW